MFKFSIICKIILCICFLFVATVFGDYSFDQWSTENGLPHNTVRRIVQTPDGYLWVTTFDGLSRFDGVRFETFNSINTKEITDNRFLDAFIEDDGTLWASMLNGSIVRYKDGKFKPFQVAERVSKTTHIRFKKDKNGKILIINGNRKLWKAFHLDKDKLVLAPKEYQNPDRHWLFSSDEKYWEITPDGVTEYNRENTTNYSISLVGNLTRLVGKYSFFEDKNGSLWLGDSKNLYKLSDGEFQTFNLPKFLSTQANDDLSIQVTPSLEDKEGGIWVEVKINRSSHIYRFKKGEVDFTEKNLVYTFKTGNFIFVFKDKEGFIWLGSLRGLFRFRKDLVQSLSTEQGLSTKQIYPIFERKNGEILIGSIQNLNVYKNRSFSQLTTIKNFRALEEDKRGRLWMSSIGVLVKKGIRIKKLLIFEDGNETDLTNLIDATNIWAIKLDEKDNVWVGTTNGLYKFKDDKVVQNYSKKDGLLSDDISFIHESANGVLWLGTAQGIAKLENDEFTTFTTEDGLAGNQIRTIYEDNSGSFWIGTYGNGLSRFKDGKFFNYSTKEGLYHNGVFQIFEDDNENFWIGGNQGIYRVAKKDLNDYADGKIKRVNSFGYGKQDGMLNVEVNGGRQPAGIKASDGRLWFPTMDGVAIIDPKNIEYNSNVPNALIENVTIEREEVEMLDNVTVGVGKDDIEIHYTAPSFIKPKQIKFKYKLEGFNDDWIEAGTRRTAYYSYLPPGDYTFRLLVANSDGIWNEQETTLNIKVLAPFYRTNWFFALVILGIIAIAFLLYRYRINHFEKRNAEQIAFSRQLISLQEAERKRIAAGLHDGLSHHLIIIKNWTSIISQMLKSGESVDEQLDEISESSLQALSEVREITNDLRPHRIENLGVTDTIESMIEKVESSSGINFDYEADVIDHLFNKEDEVIFYRIIQECVNNIIKHSEATDASVSIKNGSKIIKVKISDNGKGFKLNEKPTTSQQSGFGLTGIVERIKMLGGEQTITSELGKGTTVDIKIELN